MKILRTFENTELALIPREGEFMNIDSKRPIMLLIDLLGRKWLMRIIWELRDGSTTFRELQNKCGEISPTIVNKRLKELLAAKLVSRSKPAGYKLTPLGEKLMDLFNPINEWVKLWEKECDLSNTGF